MAKDERNKIATLAKVSEGYQAAGNEDRGHQPSKALDKGYQANSQAKRPTVAPKVGTTAVVPVASTANNHSKK